MVKVKVFQEILSLYAWEYEFKTKEEAIDFSKNIIEEGFGPDDRGIYIEDIGLDNDDNIEIQINGDTVYAMHRDGEVLENTLFEEE